MPLTLEQYADWLANRDIPWPAAPQPDPIRAKPSLPSLPDVRCVLWNVYGTLLSISQGELVFEHPDDAIMSIAFDKTIHEFKMWQSMSRKPGQPSEYMREIYKRVLLDQKAASGSERIPELLAEKVWDGIIKKLFQKEYTFDAVFYGGLNEYSKKIAFFFHASMQGTACYPGVTEALRAVQSAGMSQGLLADGQAFTPAQLYRGVNQQEEDFPLDEVLLPELRILSCDHKARKPSDTLMKAAVKLLAAQGFDPAEVLHVGSNLQRDIAPAKKLGMRTALFAGDRNSLNASAEQLKDTQFRPDALLTELPQIAQILG